jgi:energy-coupling factor transport system permease protein
VAWWVWALGLAAAASQTTNPLVLLTLVGVATVVVMARRSDQPWARSFRLYVIVGCVIVVMRVAFRIVLGGGGAEGGTVVLDLPEVPLPGWVLGITLFGPVTQEALLAGLYDGLRLATIVICVGAANSLANPKRLLRSVPAALHEIGTALVVAVTVLPQFADSARRVRLAQSLRAGDTRRVGRLRRYLVPVLEDALERSLRLAAGMDTRGYGRTAGATVRERRATGALMLAGLCGVCVGVYAGLDQTAPRILAAPMLVLGIVVAVLGLVGAGRRVARSTYRPDPWRMPELVVMASGLTAAIAMWWVVDHQMLVAYPELTSWPTLTPAALIAATVGLVAAPAAPEPRLVLA